MNLNSLHTAVKIIECPRDAMQGLHDFVPTALKIEYINKLLQVGFDTIDFGSFVSPKAIPQLRDTVEVLNGLDLSNTKSKLLAIIANVRGATDACVHEQIKYLGFPFSISETFQQRNTNSSIAQSYENVKTIQELCMKHNKELVIYISMGFGNPYGDAWNTDVVNEWTEKISSLGVNIISLADTVGVAKPDDIRYIFKDLIPRFKNVEFGAHLHCTPDNWMEKTDAAYQSGCKRFDAAIKGFGGCPMASDKLTGNLATENLVHYLSSHNVEIDIDLNQLYNSIEFSNRIFNVSIEN